MNRPRLPARRLAALAAGLTLLVGCSSEPDAPAAAPAPPPPAADVLVRASGATTAAAGTARFSVASTRTIGEQTVVLAGEGVYDFAARKGVVSFEVPDETGAGTAGTIEQSMIVDDLFVVLPREPGVYYRMPLVDAAATAIGGSTDPTAGLQAVAGVGTVEEVGEQLVRDVPTTHYEGTYDVATVLAQAQGSARAVLEASLLGAPAVQVPFEVFLDDQGRMVRYEQSLELEPAPETGMLPLTSTLEIELYDFGTRAVVWGPVPTAVKDGSALLDALRQLGPTVASAAAQAAAEAAAQAPAAPPPAVPDPAAPPPAVPDPAVPPPAPVPAPPAPAPEG